LRCIIGWESILLGRNDLEERRRYPRYPTKLPIQFSVLGEEPDPKRKLGKYWTKDVSQSGMRFESNRKLEKGTRISIGLHIIKESFSDFVTQDPIQVEGKVIWDKEYEDEPGNYELGVEFSNLLEIDQKRIQEWFQFLNLEEG
jgi:c-di-GMP-binding flagellar brake protein YcgR